MSRATSARRAIPGAIRWIVLLGFAVYCLIPLLWLLFAPSKSDAQLVNDAPLSFGSLGQFWTSWQNLSGYGGGVIADWAWNSLYYSGGALLITLVTSLLAGYALALNRIPFRRSLLILTLTGMMIPPTALVLPVFLEINALQLTNTAFSVILPASFYPFGVYLAYIYFSTSVPKDLLEAARLDGCGELRLFWHLGLPLAKPLIGLLAFFSFVANWNNYFLPYVMLSDESKYNLPVGLGALISGTPALNPSSGGSLLSITRPEVALAGLIVIVPIAIIFLFCQRFLVKGILDGSVKG